MCLISLNFKSTNHRISQFRQVNQVLPSTFSNISVCNECPKKKDALETEKLQLISTGLNGNMSLGKNQEKCKRTKTTNKTSIAEVESKEKRETKGIKELKEEFASIVLPRHIRRQYRYTPSEYRILLLLLSYHKNVQAIPSHDTLMDIFGIKQSTITRALRHFARHAHIASFQPHIKKKKKYTFSPDALELYFEYLNNTYTNEELEELNNGVSRVDILRNRNTNRKQIIRLLHGLIRKENDDRVNSNINKYIYISRNLVFSRGSKELSTKDRMIKALVKIRKMLTQEQKHYITANKNNPTTRKALENKEISKLLFSESHEKLTAFLQLGLRERLELSIFSEDILKHVYNQLYFNQAWRDKIQNPYAYALSLCKKAAAEVKFPVEWEWYYTLCEIFGIDTTPPVQSDNSSRVTKVMSKSESSVMSDATKARREREERERLERLEKDRLKEIEQAAYMRDREAQLAKLASLTTFAIAFATPEILHKGFPALSIEEITEYLAQRRRS